MNPRQIEAFRAVVRLGSMTSAAELLGISQPAVSRLIRDLEEDLGLRLFRREGNRLSPTHESLILFEEVDLYYRGLAQIEKVARDLRNQLAGTLRIAAPSSFSTMFLPDVIAEFMVERPTVSVSLSSFSSPLIIERVALQQYEIGMVQISGEHPGVRVVNVPRLPAVCILHRDHPLAAHEVLTPELLRDEPFISHSPNSALRARVDAVFAEHGIKRQQRVEADLAGSIRALVARGAGVSIVDPLVVTALVQPDLVVRPFVPAIPFEVALVVPARRNLSANAQRFLELIQIRFREKAAFLGPERSGAKGSG